eukprot:symbB.v1.2.005269.t2/scaffold286.1/size306100/8
MGGFLFGTPKFGLPGWPVVDADKIAHELLADKEGAVHQRIVAEFGVDVLTDGVIDRDKLGKVVFADPSKRRKLDKATHTAILLAILRRIITLIFDGHKTIVLDVPLLLKFPVLRRWCLSAVLVIVVSPEVQLRRLMARNNLSEEEAKMKIASQLSGEEQRKLADFVIENNGTLEELQHSVEDFYRESPEGWSCGKMTCTGLGALSSGAVCSLVAGKAGLYGFAQSLVGCLGGVCLVEMALKEGAEAAFSHLRHFELKGTQVSLDWSTMAKTEMGMCKKRKEKSKDPEPTRSFKERPTEESLGFRLQQVVLISNLKGAPQFNGQRACVVGFRSDRVEVEIEADGAKKTLALKPENLSDASEDAPAAEAPAEAPDEEKPAEATRKRRPKWEENSGGFVVVPPTEGCAKTASGPFPSIAELEQMSMKELKQVLKEHAVDTTGCLEKAEFQQKAMERAKESQGDQSTLAMATWYGSAESKTVSSSGSYLRAFAVGCSNFSIQYNYQCASIAMAIMATHGDYYVTNPAKADFPTAPWVQKTLLAVVFAGSVAGMLFMGILGDYLGHRRALLLTKALVVLGALMCILLPEEASDNFWTHLALWRFVIGVGLGGAYPLTAAVAGGSDQVGKAFFWQTPGSVAPYVVALILVELVPGQTGLQFRWVLGLGALPSLVALFASLPTDATDATDATLSRREDLMQGFREAFGCPELQRRLLGTAGSWFLFDVAAYGTVVFTPHILSIFGDEQSLVTMILHSILLLSFSIPATWLSVVALPMLGAKKLNLYGFVLQAVLFTSFASSYSILHQSQKVLLTLLCAIYFGLNWGVCVSTYVLPVQVFPEEFRGTLHGVSAASGKLGALVGAGLFPFLNAAGGVPAVMGLQALVCGLGALLSYLCLPPSEA